MKGLFLSMALFVGLQTPVYAQKTNPFNVEKFEKALIEQMEITFPEMTLDTTLRFVTRARSAEEARYHESHASGKGGMVNTANDETDEAVRLVAAYKKHLEEVLYFDEKALKRCRFTEFCATATAQYGGLVRYGIVIDNNITRESIINSSDELINGN
jgi:predicted NUDIX family phosphoesterase